MCGIGVLQIQNVQIMSHRLLVISILHNALTKMSMRKKGKELLEGVIFLSILLVPLIR